MTAQAHPRVSRLASYSATIVLVSLVLLPQANASSPNRIAPFNILPPFNGTSIHRTSHYASSIGNSSAKAQSTVNLTTGNVTLDLTADARGLASASSFSATGFILPFAVKKTGVYTIQANWTASYVAYAKTNSVCTYQGTPPRKVCGTSTATLSLSFKIVVYDITNGSMIKYGNNFSYPSVCATPSGCNGSVYEPSPESITSYFQLGFNYEAESTMQWQLTVHGAVNPMSGKPLGASSKVVMTLARGGGLFEVGVY